jgi:hypothetical protein
MRVDESAVALRTGTLEREAGIPAMQFENCRNLRKVGLRAAYCCGKITPPFGELPLFCHKTNKLLMRRARGVWLMSGLEIENERLSAEVERLKADVERRGELITTLEDEIERLQADVAMRILESIEQRTKIERLQADGAMRIERLRAFIEDIAYAADFSEMRDIQQEAMIFLRGVKCENEN